MRVIGIARGIALALGVGAVEALVVGERVGIRANHVGMHEGGTFAGAAVFHRAVEGGVGWRPDRCRRSLQNGSSGNPDTRREMLPPAVCTSTGTEIAYSLSCTTKTTGSRRLAAVFSASQNSPSLVVPSPSET